jgi:DNA-directed RNA polymerase alpha subunit
MFLQRTKNKLQLEPFYRFYFLPGKKYSIENFRVEQKTDYEKLVLNN